MRKQLLFLLFILSLSACHTQKPKGLLINLNAKDFHYALLAFHHADEQLKLGHPVVIYLNAKATAIADPSSEYAIKELNGYTPYQSLEELISKGVKVLVCQVCMERQKIDPGFMIEGARVASPELLAKYLYDPSYRVLNW